MTGQLLQTNIWRYSMDKNKFMEWGIVIGWLFIAIISSFNFDTHSVIIWVAAIIIISYNRYTAQLHKNIQKLDEINEQVMKIIKQIKKKVITEIKKKKK